VWRYEHDAEEVDYDPTSGRLVGNFPQAFTHVGLVEAARRLEPS
jgi:GH15 family glucan-1,4-alpha-glucosidase